MNAIEKEFKAYINAWEKENLNQDTIDLINQANYDLYFGPKPIGEDDYPGFEIALERIETSLANIPTEVYVDQDGFVTEGEPEPWTDEETGETLWPEYWAFDKKDILAAILGKELANYL